MYYVSSSDNLYPSRIKEVIENPQGLFIEGTLERRDQISVAIVGTRDPSEWGMAKAYEFSFKLAKEGITVVSGLALGIDAIAHKAALDAHGRTIAVLAGGLDSIYPKENIPLAKAISLTGALVSQYPPGTSPLAKNFLARNELIAALSLAVVIVEGRRRSGTLSTATHAANLNREVFAIKGQENFPQSEVTNYLIANGANSIDNPETILDYINKNIPQLYFKAEG